MQARSGNISFRDGLATVFGRPRKDEKWQKKTKRTCIFRKGMYLKRIKFVLIPETGMEFNGKRN